MSDFSWRTYLPKNRTSFMDVPLSKLAILSREDAQDSECRPFLKTPVIALQIYWPLNCTHSIRSNKASVFGRVIRNNPLFNLVISGLEPTTCTANIATWPCRLPWPNATAIWEPVTALVPTPSKLFALSPWMPSRPADLLLSKCTTPRSNSLCLLAYRSPRDHFSRPTDQTHTFCKFCFLVGF